MQTFKQYLTEATSTEVSTALETVLGVAYEAASARGDQKKVLITLMNKSAHKSKFSKANAFWKTNKGTTISDIDADNLLIFGKKVRVAVGGGDGSFSFQNKGNVTADWAKWSGKEIIKYEKDGVTVKSTTTKKDVSKTDIVLGKKKYSVKNADGAQLMSGKKGESIATAEAAALTSGLDPALLSKLTNGFNALEAFTTEGYYASIENLKSLYTNKKRKLKLY